MIYKICSKSISQVKHIYIRKSAILSSVLFNAFEKEWVGFNGGGLGSDTDFFFGGGGISYFLQEA